jgi:hypothetical protein
MTLRTPSNAYSHTLRTPFERLCSHSPLYLLGVRRCSNPSLGLGARLRPGPRPHFRRPR